MSIRRTDILALTGLRNDGRKSNEVRHIRVQMGVSNDCVSGSALVEMGLTSAMATVVGPIDCARRSDENSDRAVLQVSFQTLSPDRRVGSSDRRIIEAARCVQRAIESALLLSIYPKQRICVVVTILSDDGGRLCAAINATTLALIDAGLPMRDWVCSCSAGGRLFESEDVLVDLNRAEEGQGSVFLPAAIMPQRGTLVLTQCEARLPSWNSLERVLDAAINGCKTIFLAMKEAVRAQAALRLKAQAGLAHVTEIHVSSES